MRPSAPSTSIVLAAACLAFALALPAAGAADDALRVLFVGNSYTRFHDLPGQVERIAESVPGGPRLMASREAHGGYDLVGHWRRGRARRRIERGRWDAVVLQPHSLAPLEQRAQLLEYARRFQAEARAVGARVVLFETWARHPRHALYRRLPLGGPEQMQAQLVEVYAELGRELGAAVAPVGRAWAQAHRELPELALHRPDGTHPAIAGTYLSACVFYGTLTGRDPREATWRPWRLSRREGARIREIAAASLGTTPAP